LCYTDSQTVLDLISKSYNSYQYHVAVIASIQDMLKLDWDVTFSHSKREDSFSADFLAKHDTPNDVELSFSESPLEELEIILLFNVLRVLHPRA